MLLCEWLCVIFWDYLQVVLLTKLRYFVAGTYVSASIGRWETMLLTG